MRRLQRSLLLLLAAMLVFGAVASAQDVAPRGQEFITKNSEGREFWLCFMKNFRTQAAPSRQNRPQALKLQLFITSSYDAKVKIEIEEIGYENTVDVRANTVVNVQIPARAQLRANETAERLAVHITADTTIAVYGLNSRYQTTDTFVGLPVSVLGTQYRIMGYTKLAADLLSEFTIVATEDDTEVQIVPTTITSTGRPAGRPFNVRLRKGDVYTVGARWQSIGPCDLTGSLITASKKIAVFSGHQCAYVPPKIEACNHLIEQIPPITAWGKHYYLGMLKERSKFTYRVVASEPNTRVFKNSRLMAVLNPGEFHEELNVSEHIQVTADKPVMVAQFAQGFKNGDSVGDPMMILVSPTQQFLKVYRFATPINGDWHHYINVVAQTDAIGDIRLNGRRIESNLFQKLGESRYSIAQVPIPFGTHVIRSETPFGLYSYGFGYDNDAYDAYGNMAGQSFFELSTLIDSLPPMADGANARDYYQVIFRDDRPMDQGMDKVEVVSKTALDVAPFTVEPGAPQVAITVRPSVSGSGGRLVLKATDVAGNSSYFTVCYVFDSRSERYVYVLNEGRGVECVSEDGWLVGAFGSLSHTRMDANVPQTEGLTLGGPLVGQGEGLAGGFGVLAGRRFAPEFIATGRLSMGWVGGTLLAPDTTVGAVLDTASGQRVPYQEGTQVSIDAPYLRIGGTIQWFPLRYFYLTGGAQVALALGSSATVERTLLRPGHYTYPDGSTTRDGGTSSLPAFSSVGFELLGGLGVSYPVTYRASVFFEALYTHRLNSMLSDAPLNLDALGVNLGVLWRL